MLNKDRRLELVIQLTETIWELKKYEIYKAIEQLNGAPIPDECKPLMEHTARLMSAHTMMVLNKEAK